MTPASPLNGNPNVKERWMSREESYNAQQQRVLTELTRLWISTQKSRDQEANQEALLSQFFLTVAKYPFTALQQTVDRWIEESRWFPSAMRDFEDELRKARDRVTPMIEDKNTPWRAIKSSSTLTWARRLVQLYEQQHGGLEMKFRHQLESQAMAIALSDGAGSFGVHPHPVWTAQKCLQLTRYA